MQFTYTSIKKSDKRLRLWIEGAKPITAGFSKGSFYKRTVHHNGNVTVVFTLLEPSQCETLTKKEMAEQDIFVVSGRSRNNVDIPIIDSNLARYEDMFPDGTRVRAVFTHGIIKVTIHHEEMSKRRREQSFIDAVKAGELTEASFCTGGGISTTAVNDGISLAGLSGRVAWVVDADLRYLQSAYQHSYAITDETTCFECTLEEVESEFVQEVNVLSFSLPCSGFSKSGAAKHKLSAEEHESGTSLFGAVNLIKASNAAVLLSENVVEAKGSPIYVLLIQELKRLGYTVLESILDSTNTGSFENRKRYWFVAYSSGLPAECFADAFNFFSDKKYESFSELADKHVDDSQWSDHEYLKEKQIRDEQNGKGFAKRQLLTEDSTFCGTIGRHYAKRRSTEPFPVNAEGKERLLTIYEHARAKSIPECLVAFCSQTVGHEILGQSIDYLQAREPIQRIFARVKAQYLPNDSLNEAA